MKKIIKKIGTSAGIIFSKEDMTILGANIGDVVEMSDVVVIKKKKKEVKKQKKKKVKDPLQDLIYNT